MMIITIYDEIFAITKCAGGQCIAKGVRFIAVPLRNLYFLPSCMMISSRKRIFKFLHYLPESKYLKEKCGNNLMNKRG